LAFQQNLPLQIFIKIALAHANFGKFQPIKLGLAEPPKIVVFFSKSTHYASANKSIHAYGKLGQMSIDPYHSSLAVDLKRIFAESRSPIQKLLQVHRTNFCFN
jgi:hypothetical protein